MSIDEQTIDTIVKWIYAALTGFILFLMAGAVMAQPYGPVDRSQHYTLDTAETVSFEWEEWPGTCGKRAKTRRTHGGCISPAVLGNRHITIVAKKSIFGKLMVDRIRETGIHECDHSAFGNEHIYMSVNWQKRRWELPNIPEARTDDPQYLEKKAKFTACMVQFEVFMAGVE